MPSLFKKLKNSASQDTEPIETHDYAASDLTPPPSNVPTASETPAGAAGQASVLVEAEKADGKAEIVGSAAQNPTSPALLLDEGGLPASGLPQGTNVIDAMVTSGARGLGPEGTKTLKALEAEAGAVGRDEFEAKAVVAPAKGVAPEVVMRAVSPTPEGAKTTILPKMGTKNRSVSNASRHSSTLAAITQILPENILGVNLSSLGMPPQTAEKMAKDVVDDEAEHAPTGDQRENLPTQLRAGEAAAEEDGGVDRVSEGLAKIATAPDVDNVKFHKIFPAVPSEDRLIETWVCALQRQILIQGKMYLSQHHLSFYASILGVETAIIVPLSEIVAIEKRMTALVIPNGLEFATLHARHTFASLLHRDDTFDRIVEVWRLTHPETSIPPITPKRASIVAASAEEGDALPPATTLAQPSSIQSVETAPTKATRTGSVLSFETTDTQGHPVKKRKKHLKRFLASRLKNEGSSSGDEAEGVDEGEAGEGHAPTKCTCSGDDGHYKEVALDAKFPASPEKIFYLLWSSGFMMKFLTENQKLTELQLGDWHPGFEETNAKREVTYIKALNASMGPKSTKCYLTDTNERIDYDTFCTTLTITRTPDVPVGSSFEVRTRTCITHAGGGRCRVYVTTEVHWHQTQRLLKGVIERSAVDGQVTYHRDLATEVRAHIKANPAEFGNVAGGADDEADDAKPDETKSAPSSSLLSSIGLDLSSPLTGNIFLGLLVFLLLSNLILFIRLRHARSSPSRDIETDIQQITKLLSKAEGRLEALKKRAEKVASAL